MRRNETEVLGTKGSAWEKSGDKVKYLANDEPIERATILAQLLPKVLIFSGRDRISGPVVAPVKTGAFRKFKYLTYGRPANTGYYANLKRAFCWISVDVSTKLDDRNASFKVRSASQGENDFIWN
jgi:hypothetical protein